MASNGLVVTGVLVLVSQMVFVSKVPKCRGAMGNWEIGKTVEACTSQFPNFPKDLSPSGSALFGKLGNYYRYILPNFSNNPSPDGQALFGKSGNL